jgi:cell division protein FtsB
VEPSTAAQSKHAAQFNPHLVERFIPKGIMTRRLRILLFLFGLALMAGALCLLAYAAWPAETQQLQATLQPTLFIAP